MISRWSLVYGLAASRKLAALVEDDPTCSKNRVRARPAPAAIDRNLIGRRRDGISAIAWSDDIPPTLTTSCLIFANSVFSLSVTLL
jgi:hypothetical protein